MGDLSGISVLVTRPAGQAAGLVEPLEARGATVFSLPAIEIAPPLDPEALDEALRNVGSYDWVVATSVNGVQALGDRRQALGLRMETFDGVKLAAVGPSTAAAFRQAFREPDAVPQEFVGERVAEAMGDVRGKRFLLARADIARKDLPERLRAMGAEVDDVAAYRIVRPSPDGPLPEVAPDWIALTSSSGVIGTRDALAAGGKEEWMRSARLACIGPLTAATVLELGYEVEVMAEAHTILGLVEAIVREHGYAATTPSPTAPPPAHGVLVRSIEGSEPQRQGEPSPEASHA